MEALGISLEVSASGNMRRIDGMANADYVVDRGAHTAQTVQVNGTQAAGKIGQSDADGLLRFRDEWVKNRARDIRRAASVSFNACSEDTASITAMNEFYRLRVFDGFIADEISPKDVVVAEKGRMCRSVNRKARGFSDGVLPVNTETRTKGRRRQWAR
jgi:hypothetical protein